MGTGNGEEPLSAPNEPIVAFISGIQCNFFALLSGFFLKCQDFISFSAVRGNYESDGCAGGDNCALHPETGRGSKRRAECSEDHRRPDSLPENGGSVHGYQERHCVRCQSLHTMNYRPVSTRNELSPAARRYCDEILGRPVSV